MIALLEKTVLDCPDPGLLAGFYARLLGMEVVEENDGWVVIGRAPGFRELAFQRVADHRPPEWPSTERSQQVHLDIRVSDVDEAEALVLGWGARRAPGSPETGYRVFTDPAGHPFCLVFGPGGRNDARWVAATTG